jgi:hypothetical protein
MENVNWKAKVAIQAVLAHLPGGEAINHRLQWANGRYTHNRLKRRIHEQARKFSKLAPYIQDGVVVEVGTGWELIAPILFHLMGAREIHTYDHLRHLRFEIPKRVIECLDATELGFVIPNTTERIQRLKQLATLEELFSVAGICYHAPADARKTGLPDGCSDLFFTYEVLEHIPEEVLDGLVIESKRVLKQHGVAYHAIEPGDHYTRETSHVNHYRYPEWLWRILVKNDISYHNRLPLSRFIQCFERHGASISSIVSQICDRDLANLNNGFSRDLRFINYSLEDLSTWYAEITYCFIESQS